MTFHFIQPFFKNILSTTNISTFLFFIQQSCRDARLYKIQYFLGCTSVLSVVFLVAILLATFQYSPLVFLNLAESASGQLDLQYVAGAWTGSTTLNYTKMSEWTEQLHYKNQFSAPRYSGDTLSVFNPKMCRGYKKDKPFDNLFSYQGPDEKNWHSNESTLKEDRQFCSKTNGAACLYYLCQQKSIPANFYLIDTILEKNAGIGRQWSKPPLLLDRAYIQSNLASNLNVTKGDIIMISFDIAYIFQAFWNDLLSQPPVVNLHNQIAGQTFVNVPYQVEDIFGTNMGKVPNGEQKAIILEYQYILQHIASMLSPKLNAVSPWIAQHLIEATKMGFLYQYARQVYFSCGPNRVDCYLKSNYRDVAKTIIQWASDLDYQLGFPQLTASLPLLSALSSTQIFSSFLNLILSIVLVFMSCLCIFLIYSLLIVSVETKTFEMGIFRMVGMTRWGVIQLLLVQALSYALPAWAAGLLLAQISFLGVAFLFENYAYVTISTFLSPESIWGATFFGIAVPLLAVILPIRQALTNNLQDSLKTRSSSSKGVIFTIERTNYRHPPAWILLTGFLLSTFGFAIYYFLPMALVFQDYTLLFNMFLVIIVGMMVGLVVLSLNLQPLLQRILVWIIFKFFLITENKAVPSLVVKNLTAHKLRNKKTSIMYALNLGFIIFLSVSVNVELAGLSYE